MADPLPPTQEAIELKPCRECGAPCSVQVFTSQHIIGEARVWVCSKHRFLGGNCLSTEAYLTAEAWNTRPILEGDEALERLKGALTIAIAALGRVSTRCFDRETSPLKPIGDIARDALNALCTALGDAEYDTLALQALASLPPTPSRVLAEALGKQLYHRLRTMLHEWEGRPFGDEAADDAIVEKWAQRLSALAQYNASPSTGSGEAGWQPIETAPKDGTHFLACNSRESFGYRDGPLPAVQTVVHWFAGGFYTSVNELEPQRPFPATHWKALDEPAPPPSPASAKPEGGEL